VRRHGHLLERVVAWDNLLLAARKAARGKRSRPEVARFLFDLEPELLRLQAELAGGTWQPGPYRTFHVLDPKPRRISAARFADRVVHHALMNVLDPVFDRCLVDSSFACRRGKGTHRAVAAARALARRHRYFLKGDVEHCFETIPHDRLQALLRRKLKDPGVLLLLDRVVGAAGDAEQPGQGLPIGNLTSQYFANHYLGGLDQFVTGVLRVGAYLRYMDDFVLFGASAAELHRHRGEVAAFLRERLGLQLKEAATFVAPTRCGLPFLGFAVFPGTVRLRPERRRRTRRRVVAREREWSSGEITAAELARSVQSSLAHAAHAATLGLRRRWFDTTLPEMG